MNRNAIYLLVAFAAGAGISFLVTKKLLEDHYAEIAQEEIDNVKEFYGRTSAERLAKQVTDAQDDSDKPVNTNGALSRNSITEGKTAYGHSKTAYHELAKENMMKRWNEELGSAREMDDDEDPEEDEDEQERDDAGYSEGDMENDYHERDLSGIDRTLPYVIDDQEYSNEFDHHDKLSLYYYMEDDTLCDENEDIVDDIDGTVGWDCFETLKMQTTAWVRNEPLSTDYEIISIRGKYSEAVHGIHIRNEDAGLTPRERYLKNQRRRLNGEE